MNAKIILAALLCAFFVLADTVIAADSGRKQTVTDQMSIPKMKITVLSDIHVMAPELLVEDGPAYQDYIAGDRKLLKEGPEILKTAVTKILADRPDIVLISGDLTKDGEYASHKLVSETLLRPLADAGIRTFVIPGNHDINNPDAVEYHGDSTVRTRTVSADEFAAFYQDYGYGEAVDTWSVGCVMAELLNGKPLFSGQGDIEQLGLISGLLGSPDDQKWPGFSQLPGSGQIFFKEREPANISEMFPAWSPEAIDLFQQFIVYEPNRRISAREAMKHKWFFVEPAPLMAPFDGKSFDMFNAVPI